MTLDEAREVLAKWDAYNGPGEYLGYKSKLIEEIHEALRVSLAEVDRLTKGLSLMAEISAAADKICGID